MKKSDNENSVKNSEDRDVQRTAETEMDEEKSKTEMNKEKSGSKGWWTKSIGQRVTDSDGQIELMHIENYELNAMTEIEGELWVTESILIDRENWWTVRTVMDRDKSDGQKVK